MSQTTDLFKKVPKWERGQMFAGFLDKSGCQIHIPFGVNPSEQTVECLIDTYTEFFENQPEPNFKDK